MGFHGNAVAPTEWPPECLPTVLASRAQGQSAALRLQDLLQSLSRLDLESDRVVMQARCFKILYLCYLMDLAGAADPGSTIPEPAGLTPEGLRSELVGMSMLTHYGYAIPIISDRATKLREALA